MALVSGVLALGGGLLQAALSLMLWPVRRYQPERRVLADLYRQLASAAIVPTGPEGGPPASEQSTVARESLSGLGNDNSLEAERYCHSESGRTYSAEPFNFASIAQEDGA